MSLENAIGFVQKMTDDESVKGAVTGKSQAEMLAYASGLGFDFTIDELEEVCEYASTQSEEIDVEELEKVVGGIAPLLVVGAIGATFSAANFTYNLGKGEGWW